MSEQLSAIITLFSHPFLLTLLGIIGLMIATILYHERNNS